MKNWYFPKFVYCKVIAERRLCAASRKSGFVDLYVVLVASHLLFLGRSSLAVLAVLLRLYIGLVTDLCRLGLSPALNSLLLERVHVEVNEVTAVLVVVDALGTVALLQLLLDDAALHGADPRLTDSESARAKDG